MVINHPTLDNFLFYFIGNDSHTEKLEHTKHTLEVPVVSRQQEAESGPEKYLSFYHSPGYPHNFN